MAMEETAYAVGSIVWVKVTGGKWWPGEVVSADSCPEEVTKGLKKDPLAIVKYFDEDYYELVKSHSHIQPFSCSKRKDFIKKGRELLKQDPNLDKFDKDVAEAEKLCGTYDLFSLEDRNISPLGNHGDFPRAEHNHGSALVSSSLPPPPPPPPKPNASSVHVESLLSDANDSRTNASGATNDSFVGTPRDVRIRTQESPNCMISPLSAGNGSFGPYSCDVCGFQTSRIANIIIHHKSHTEHHLHNWPSINSNSPKSTTTTQQQQQQNAKKSKKANSDGKLVNKQKQKQKPTASSSALQKLKRKLIDGGGSDGDGKAKRKKTSMSKQEEVKSFQASLQSGDGVHAAQVAKSKANKVTDEKKQKEPKKKPKKKEDDSDAVFEKIKKLGMKRMNRKRGRSSYMSMGPSTSPLKSFKRDDISDESSDEGEFLIMREDINSKEEEQDEEGKFADENDRSDEVAIVEDKDREAEEIVTPHDEQLAEKDESAQEKLPDGEDNNVVADGSAVVAATSEAEGIHVDESSSVDRSLREAVAPTDYEHDKKDSASPSAAAEVEEIVVDGEGEVEIEEHGSGGEQIPAAPIMAAEVNGLASSAEEENDAAEEGKANDSHDDQEILQIPLPSVIGTGMSATASAATNSYDVANSDHSYDSNKMLDTSNNVDTYDFVDDPADSASPPPTREESGDLPPLPPPLPPTPPPPPPPPSPPANDYAMSTAANVIIDPGDIPLPPSKVPETPSAAATSSLIIEEPPLEYTKLETLVQPPDMALPSDDVYGDVADDVVSVAVDTEIAPMVDQNEIIQIGNEQVIDTSMDVFCNEIVIESDDKPPGVEEVIEYEDICLLADDKTKLLENNSVVCDAVQLISASSVSSASTAAAAAAENGLTKELDPTS